MIRDEQDIYDILTNREEFEYLLQKYERILLDREEEQLQVCCDENTPCVPNIDKLKSKIKEELEKSHKEQLVLFKANKQNIIDFLLDNKDSIKVEDLKIYEPVYKCYRQKGNCHICNSLSNIICTNCCNNNNHKEIWLCTNHWQEYIRENHAQ